MRSLHVIDRSQPSVLNFPLFVLGASAPHTAGSVRGSNMLSFFFLNNSTLPLNRLLSTVKSMARFVVCPLSQVLSGAGIPPGDTRTTGLVPIIGNPALPGTGEK